MHNSLAHPNSFKPPPAVKPDQFFTNSSYAAKSYPAPTGFYGKDRVGAYNAVVDQEGKKPMHLLEYDLRFFEENNTFTRGNPLYNAD